jgi:hypothetical protein
VNKALNISTTSILSYHSICCFLPRKEIYSYHKYIDKLLLLLIM